MSGKFHVGDSVRVRQAKPDGNPRTPNYVRGKQGVVAEIHGVINNPLDHRGLYPPLYTVVFDLGEVLGRAGIEKLYVDIHEEWLERA